MLLLSSILEFWIFKEFFGRLLFPCFNRTCKFYKFSLSHTAALMIATTLLVIDSYLFLWIYRPAHIEFSVMTVCVCARACYLFWHNTLSVWYFDACQLQHQIFMCAAQMCECFFQWPTNKAVQCIKHSCVLTHTHIQKRRTRKMKQTE